MYLAHYQPWRILHAITFTRKEPLRSPLLFGPLASGFFNSLLLGLYGTPSCSMFLSAKS